MELPVFVAGSDAVGDLGIGPDVLAGRVNSQDLRSQGNVLGHRHQLIAVLENGRIVVDVQYGDGDVDGGGQARGGAPVRRSDGHLVR